MTQPNLTVCTNHNQLDTRTDFEHIRFDYFDLFQSNLNDANDPNVNYFNEMANFDTPYYFPEQLQNMFATCSNENQCSFPIFHLNIRSLRKNVEDFKILVNDMKCSIK